VARIHILGAPGSGTTSLGLALAAAAGWPHHDADDALWARSDPPFSRLRPVPERQALLSDWLGTTRDWVFSGCALGWGSPFEPLAELVVFLRLDPALRMARLRAREAARHGRRIAPGGDMHESHRRFMDWAEAYDTAGAEQRSRLLHAAWLADRPCPVLHLDSADQPAPALAREVLGHLMAMGPAN
jgi:adenylate kinase family enzyme